MILAILIYVFKIVTKSRAHIDPRQNMNWPLYSSQFRSYKYDVFTKKIVIKSNVQSSCIDNSKWPKSKLWHYCIKAMIWSYSQYWLLQLILSISGVASTSIEQCYNYTAVTSAHFLFKWCFFLRCDCYFIL